MKLSSSSLLILPLSVAAIDADLIRLLGPQGVNLWKLNSAAPRPVPQLVVQDSSYSQLAPFPEFPEHWFVQPLDHFSNRTEKFRQRYWINTRHYKKGSGGPVIVLDGGETSGEDRLPFLDTGIVDILAKATGGVGVVLEHRYYGNSIAVQNLTTDSLRFLNNAQSAADSANFLANVKFPGIDEDLTAPNTPWIYYGGSYAGARAAHMKVLYPDLVYGAIASSAVTHASLENWEYMDVISRAADPTCSQHLQDSIEFIDRILESDSAVLKLRLKALFDLAELEHDEDFVSLLESPLSSWQSKNWDPEVGSTRFDEFCEALNKPLIGIPGPGGVSAFNENTNMVTLPGGIDVPLTVYNYANYIKEHYVSQCPDSATVEDCFGTYDASQYQATSLDQTWRLWLFQVCTEWGYFTTAPPESYPRIISRLITLKYEGKICRQAFPRGKYFTVPRRPNVTSVNALGDFDIAADRLAIIDGEVDPWRPETPHSEWAQDRNDTILRPFKLIPNGVHHYDEYGLRDISQEPSEIRQIHVQMIDFVQAWLRDWKKPSSTQH